MAVPRLTGFPDRIVVTLGTAWDAGNPQGFAEDDVVILIHIPALDDFDEDASHSIQYSEDGTMVASPTNRLRVKFDHVKTTHTTTTSATYTTRRHAAHISGNNTITPTAGWSLAAEVTDMPATPYLYAFKEMFDNDVPNVAPGTNWITVSGQYKGGIFKTMEIYVSAENPDENQDQLYLNLADDNLSDELCNDISGINRNQTGQHADNRGDSAR